MLRADLHLSPPMYRVLRRYSREKRAVKEISFGDLLQDNPRNLVYLYGQYYWAQDLAEA